MVSVTSLHPPDCLWFSVLVRQFCLTAADGLSLGFSCARQVRSVNLHCGFRKLDSGGELKQCLSCPFVTVVQKERVFVPPQLYLESAPSSSHGWWKQPFKAWEPWSLRCRSCIAATHPGLCGFSLGLLNVFSNYFSFHKVFLPCFLLSPDLLHVVCCSNTESRHCLLPWKVLGCLKPPS